MPIFAVTVYLIIAITSAKLGWHKHDVRMPLDWWELLFAMPHFLARALVLFLSVMWLQWYFGTNCWGAQTEICNQCFTVKAKDRNVKCMCGGVYENQEYWKWVDDAP